MCLAPATTGEVHAQPTELEKSLTFPGSPVSPLCVPSISWLKLFVPDFTWELILPDLSFWSSAGAAHPSRGTCDPRSCRGSAAAQGSCSRGAQRAQVKKKEPRMQIHKLRKLMKKLEPREQKLWAFCDQSACNGGRRTRRKLSWKTSLLLLLPCQGSNPGLLHQPIKQAF